MNCVSGRPGVYSFSFSIVHEGELSVKIKNESGRSADVSVLASCRHHCLNNDERAAFSRSRINVFVQLCDGEVIIGGTGPATLRVVHVRRDFASILALYSTSIAPGVLVRSQCPLSSVGGPTLDIVENLVQ